MTELTPLQDGALPSGIRSRFVRDINGLRMHVLEAGFEERGRPLVLLLHGFPELAYSWRKVMLPLAAAGFRVVAPDQRGYGRTTGWDADYDGDLGSFRILNAVRDALGLVAALGHRDVALVAGHDFGASVAAWCALVRPDIFRSVALMSAPFAGPPPLPFDTASHRAAARLVRLLASMMHWPSWTARASTTNGTIRHARPMPICGTVRKGSTPSYAVIFITRARIGAGNKPLPAAVLDAPVNWRRCRPITSWIWTRTWPRPCCR